MNWITTSGSSAGLLLVKTKLSIPVAGLDSISKVINLLVSERGWDEFYTLDGNKECMEILCRKISWKGIMYLGDGGM
jgi:hypothetical protein